MGGYWDTYLIDVDNGNLSGKLLLLHFHHVLEHSNLSWLCSHHMQSPAIQLPEHHFFF
jgi:hypothetical protein